MSTVGAIFTAAFLIILGGIIRDLIHDARAQRQKARQLHEALINTHPFAAQARPEGAPAQMDLRPRRIRRRRHRRRDDRGAAVADSSHHPALHPRDYRISPGEFFDQDDA